MRHSVRRAGFTMVELMIVIAIISILALLFVVNMVHSRARAQYTGCVSNVKNIGASLEMYSTDNGHRFPTALTMVTPNYLRSIPTCPAVGGSYPYISGFTSASNPDAYTFGCTGSGGNHQAAGINSTFPRYSSAQGLIPQSPSQ